MKYLVNHKQFGTESFNKLSDVIEYLLDDSAVAKLAAIDFRNADGRLTDEHQYWNFITDNYLEYASEAGYTVVNNKEF